MFNHDDYNKLLDLYEIIDENEETVNIQNQLLNLQKDFLECMKIRIQNAKTKNELCEIIVELRYYSNLLIKKGKTVIEQSEILNEFEELEKNIAEWEEKKSELETAMADSDYTKAQKAGQEYSELEAKLEAAYSRWEELADLQ